MNPIRRDCGIRRSNAENLRSGRRGFVRLARDLGIGAEVGERKGYDADIRRVALGLN